MGASAVVTVTASAATACGSAPAPTVAISVPVTAALATGIAGAPTVVITSITAIGTLTFAYVVPPEPGHHLAVREPIAHGTDFGLVAVTLYVACKLKTQHTYWL
jgi:hypothetical protein